MSIIEVVKNKEFTSVGVRLILYEDKTCGGRIDLYELGNPSEAIFEGHYRHQINAVAKYNSITSNKKAINWAYQNI